MKVYIATLPDGCFGSAGRTWKCLDANKLSSLLNYDTEVTTITKLMDLKLNREDIVVYTSSEEDNIRLYLKDVMYFIKQKCTILPNYNILLSHENKGFQELYRSELGFGNLKGHYFFDIDDSVLPMPKVLKTISGAGSNGVYLVKDESDILDIKKKYFDVSTKRKLIKLQRRLRLRRQAFAIYNYRYKGFNRFVEQKFVPNLKNDYKILVFGDRYYCVERKIRKNDFRASGSGLLKFVKPPEAVLDFAKDIFEKLENPYASLDIAYSDKGCHLIEYQGTDFGPVALLNSSYRYLSSTNGWKKEKHNQDLEENYAYALNKFISEKYDK